MKYIEITIVGQELVRYSLGQALEDPFIKDIVEKGKVLYG